MRILFGIDRSGGCLPAIQMALDLKFPQVEVDLMHVIESVLPDGSFPDLSDNHPLTQLYLHHQDEGREALMTAAAEFEEAGLQVRTFLERGDVAADLIAHANKEQCDLIVAKSSSKGYYGSLFFGSVTKGLLIDARQSLLFVKGEGIPQRPLKAVFATDHSPYCDRCVDLMVKMEPKGIEQLTVLTANEIPASVTELLVDDLPDLKDIAPRWITEKIEERNQAICAKLAPLGAKCESRIAEMHPNEAIRKAMEETGADLLIMGAQGHGFIERLTMGSKSFHQVVNEPHSVLVLRP